LRYRNLLNEAGVATECYEYPNATHGFTHKAGADTKDAMDKTVGFLSRYLSKK